MKNIFESSIKVENGNISIINETYFSQAFQKTISPGKKIFFQFFILGINICGAIAWRKYSAMRYICAKAVVNSVL